VLVPVITLEMTEDVPFAYTFEASDPDNDPVTYQTDSTLFVVDATGAVEMTPTNDMIQGKNLAFEVTITARDNHGGVATMQVHVTIRNVNDAPSSLNLQSPEENSRHEAGESITLTGSAKDLDDGDEAGLVYRWYFDEVLVGEGKAITALLSNDNTTEITVNVRMEVVDTHGGSTNKTVAIVVAGRVIDTPGFEGAAAALALAGAAVAAAVGARRRRRD
jgi:hypothetical protein